MNPAVNGCSDPGRDETCSCGVEACRNFKRTRIFGLKYGFKGAKISEFFEGEKEVKMKLFGLRET